MPSARASLGVLIATGLPPTFDLAAVGRVEAVEDRHQRRFAGAVLADDAVDRAAFDDEIDVAVGVDGAEALVDSDELDSSFSHPAGSHIIFLYHPVKTLACRLSHANRARPEASRQIHRRLSISAGIATGSIGGGLGLGVAFMTEDRLTTLEIRGRSRKRRSRNCPARSPSSGGRSSACARSWTR